MSRELGAKLYDYYRSTRPRKAPRSKVILANAPGERSPMRSDYARCQTISRGSRNAKRFKCSATTFSNRDAVSSSGTVSAIAKMFSFDVTTHCPAGNGMSARVSFHVRSGNLWLQCFASWTRYFPAWAVSILAVLINFFSIAE
jgi:hypothetical protein